MSYLVSLVTINYGTINFFLPVLVKSWVVGEIVAGEEQGEGDLKAGSIPAGEQAYFYFPS